MTRVASIVENADLMPTRCRPGNRNRSLFHFMFVSATVRTRHRNKMDMHK